MRADEELADFSRRVTPGIPIAVDPIKILVAPCGSVHVFRGNGQTCAFAEIAKEKWVGINRSCHHYYGCNCPIDFCSESDFGSFFIFLDSGF